MSLLLERYWKRETKKSDKLLDHLFQNCKVNLEVIEVGSTALFAWQLDKRRGGDVFLPVEKKTNEELFLGWQEGDAEYGR